MAKIQAWAGIVGIVLAVLTFVSTQVNLASKQTSDAAKVRDLADAVLALQAFRDSTLRQSEIDAAVAIIRDSLRDAGRHREPTTPEIVEKLAEVAAVVKTETPPDTAANKKVEARQVRLLMMAGKQIQLPMKVKH